MTSKKKQPLRVMVGSGGQPDYVMVDEQYPLAVGVKPLIAIATTYVSLGFRTRIGYHPDLTVEDMEGLDFVEVLNGTYPDNTMKAKTSYHVSRSFEFYPPNKQNGVYFVQAIGLLFTPDPDTGKSIWDRMLDRVNEFVGKEVVVRGSEADSYFQYRLQQKVDKILAKLERESLEDPSVYGSIKVTFDSTPAAPKEEEEAY